MINELYELSEAMGKSGIEENAPARNYPSLAGGDCLCVSVKDGTVTGFREVSQNERNIIHKYGVTSKGFYPYVKLAPLFRICDKEAISIINKAKKHPELVNRDIHKQISGLCIEINCNWDKKALARCEKSLRTIPKELRSFLAESPYKPLMILTEETDRFANPMCLYEALEKAALKAIESKVDVVLALSILFADSTKRSEGKVTGAFTACDSPVGSGKTTAVMAHLLRQAIERNARRVFVVLPYTNIIKQSVDVYRESLVLPGEKPDEVVAELHCRADFQDKDTRYLTSLWRAPIIVTTAVAFFETLASNKPSALRRLHELPGSVVFVDEAHNALPLKLLPLAWQWMYTLAEEWNCYWVLASGSLVRYWQLDSLKQVKMPRPIVSELVNSNLREQLMRYEQHRVSFRWKPEAMSRRELVEWVHSMSGPRLLILNTVQSAAVIADDFCSKYGRSRVEHLSTALTAEDRSSTIERVKARLKDKSDTDWTLVATSCVEAGVDLSFQSGFRELSSLLSLLQASGRVNRNGLYPDAIMWSFTMQDDSMLKKNPGFNTSREVLKSYLVKDIEIAPELSTKSMNDEIIRDDSCLKTINHLNQLEDSKQFQDVCDEFVVIESNTVPVVVDRELAKSIEYGCGDWQLLQKRSVSIRREKIEAWCLKKLAEDVYQWTLRYDPFLGYMRGVLDVEKSKNDTLIV